MRKIILILIIGLLLISCSETTLDDISGYYEGSIDIDGTMLPISFNFVHEDDITGHLDIEVQGVRDVELRDVVSSGNSLEFMVDFVSYKVYFKGDFFDDVYSGELTQNGQTFNFSVKKGIRSIRENAVAFEYSRDNITITGEYLIPGEQVPVALIIAGSGPTDMNGNSAAGVYSNSYLYLAQTLEEANIATLRYNKRSIGNAIPEDGIVFDDFVDDAEAIVKLLKDDPRFSEVYVIGHSQGALIAKIVANRTNVDKVVLLTGAGRNIGDILIEQLSSQLDEELIEEARFVLGELKENRLVNEVSPFLHSVFGPSIQPFMVSWLGYNPVDEIKSLKNVQIIVGTEDIQVPVSDGELLLEANSNARYSVIEGMNHILKHVSSDMDENIASYQDANLPLHEELGKTIIDFFNE